MSPPAVSLGWRFADPLWFGALLLLVLVAWARRRGRVRFLVIPHAACWHRPSLRGAARWPLGLALLGVGLLTAGLARPQKLEDRREIKSRGYDIVLAIDLSGSMMSEDYERDGVKINRLAAIRPVIKAFVENRPSDRIGVVVFSRHAYTLAPLTTDHAWLNRQIDRIHIHLIEDGTAIGDALAVALSRLDQSGREAGGRRKGAFIVLLTDGQNNSGSIAPMDAARLAKAKAVPIYTIGAGKDGYVLCPEADDHGNPIPGTYQPEYGDLDEDALRDIARLTGGKFFRAAETDTVTGAFAAIDRNEKIEFQATSQIRTQELFPWLTAAGLLLVTGGALAARENR